MAQCHGLAHKRALAARGRPRREGVRAATVEVLAVGQYLRPSAWHLPVTRYYEVGEYAALRETALGLGFRRVEAGPFVRSSYHAREQVTSLRT